MSPTTRLLPLLLLVLASNPAMAHSASDIGGGFLAGLMHPVLGWDHVAAMVAVGLWGAFLGNPALWLLPVIFPLVMVVGGVLGLAGVAIPGVEIGIAASALVLGLLILGATRLPLWLAGAIVGVFAIFHGHAHGTELPHAASPLAYSLGFVISTGLLHLGGIAFGLLTASALGRKLVRGLGAVIAAAGALFLVQAL